MTFDLSRTSGRIKGYFEIWSPSHVKYMNILGYGPQGVYTLNQKTGAITTTFQEPLERGEEKALRFSLASRHLRWLQGEILTIIDATLRDERQLKAVKDLVRDKFSSKISWLYEQCGTPESEISTDAEDTPSTPN